MCGHQLAALLIATFMCSTVKQKSVATKLYEASFSIFGIGASAV